MPPDQRGDQELFLEGLLQFHPEYLRVLSEDEQVSLTHYYLAPDGVDCSAYRRGLEAADPDCHKRAKTALHKLFDLNDVHPEVDYS